MKLKNQICICVYCGRGESSHAKSDVEDHQFAYLPLSGAILSPLDCPGFEMDSAPEVVTEEL